MQLRITKALNPPARNIENMKSIARNTAMAVPVKMCELRADANMTPAAKAHPPQGRLARSQRAIPLNPAGIERDVVRSQPRTRGNKGFKSRNAYEATATVRP